MARTPTVSDQHILDAAQTVLVSRGVDSFTLSEVAKRVNLSRAAIILRFKSTRDLKAALLRRQLEEFKHFLESCPTEPGGDNLLELASKIGGYVGSRESFSFFLTRYCDNLQEEELAALEVERGLALKQAVSRAMPETAIPLDEAVTAFTAHLTGTFMAWPWSDEPNPRDYTIKQTILWLKLARIPLENVSPDTVN